MKALTPEERAKWLTFVGMAVVENLALPPMVMGGSKITVQDLIHGRTIQSLEKYADFLEKADASLSRTEKRNSLNSKIITTDTGFTVSYKEVVEFIDLTTKDSLYKSYIAEKQNKIANIEAKLKGTLSKKEQRAQLEADLAELKKEVSST